MAVTANEPGTLDNMRVR